MLLKSLFGLVLLSFGLSGCVVATHSGHHGYGHHPRVVVVKPHYGGHHHHGHHGGYDHHRHHRGHH